MKIISNPSPADTINKKGIWAPKKTIAPINKSTLIHIKMANIKDSHLTILSFSVRIPMIEAINPVIRDNKYEIKLNIKNHKGIPIGDIDRIKNIEE